MGAPEAFREALENADVAAVRRLLPLVAPAYPPPSSEEEAEATMHMARMQMTTLGWWKRVYSQRWLQERGYLASDAPGLLREVVKQAQMQ